MKPAGFSDSQAQTKLSQSEREIQIDNGWIERAIRKYAIGRNNWLFCDTVDGAKASSLFYSLVITAKLNGKDPYEVLLQILTALPQAASLEDYEKLAARLVTKPILN